MRSTGRRTAAGGQVKYLKLGSFHALMAELARYRLDSVIQMMEKNKEEGRILGFIRGLRLSAHLIYAVRDLVSSSGLEADWGHLLDKKGDYCSPECDVIIHRPGCVARWNGTEKPVMDFKFIDCREAVAVISCKSLINSVDRKYVRRMKPYVSDIIIFAECCRPGRVRGLRRSALSAGYKGFYYLYTLDAKTSECTHDEEEWCDFLRTLEKITA